MARKINSEKDIVISTASAASARPRRAGTAARPQRTASAPDSDEEVPGAGGQTSAHADTVAVERELAHEEIARLAYALWEARGCQGGSPEDDWRHAEEELRQRT